jgi:type IV pilus assembly protein PilP
MSRLALAVLTAAVLAGCGGTDSEELQQWMTNERSQARARVQPIPEPKKFTPQDYGQDASTDPFSSQKLTQALKRESSQTTSNAALIAPELARRKEALESYPLDAMAMVGSLVKTGQPVALLRVDNLLYQVKSGNYLGQNYGRITKIGETEIVLREIVQDGSGEWIERVAKLQLQEGSTK